MQDFKIFVPALLLTFLIGCSSDQAPDEYTIKHFQDVKRQIIGISKDEAFTCVGIPDKKSNENNIETWSYTINFCTVDLMIANDEKVKDVRFSMVPDPKAKPWDEPVTMEERCGKIPIITSCLHWLRH